MAFGGRRDIGESIDCRQGAERNTDALPATGAVCSVVHEQERLLRPNCSKGTLCPLERCRRPVPGAQRRDLEATVLVQDVRSFLPWARLTGDFGRWFVPIATSRTAVASLVERRDRLR